MTTKQLDKFFRYADGDEVYGISIKFTPQTYLWIDERFPAVNMLFTKKDFEEFETKYGVLKDELFVVFKGNYTNFEFKNEKRGKLKYVFNME